MMRRTLLLALAVAVTVGCAKKEEPALEAADTMAAATAAVSLADFAGTWEGKTMAMGNDTVLVTTELTATADTSGWSMKLANAKNPRMTSSTTVRVMSVAGDSVIIEAGPFPSALRAGQQVSTHAIYHLRNGMLVGTTHATYGNGDTATLRTEATRK